MPDSGGQKRRPKRRFSGVSSTPKYLMKKSSTRFTPSHVDIEPLQLLANGMVAVAVSLVVEKIVKTVLLVKVRSNRSINVSQRCVTAAFCKLGGIAIDTKLLDGVRELVQDGLSLPVHVKRHEDCVVNPPASPVGVQLETDPHKSRQCNRRGPRPSGPPSCMISQTKSAKDRSSVQVACWHLIAALPAIGMLGIDREKLPATLFVAVTVAATAVSEVFGSRSGLGTLLRYRSLRCRIGDAVFNQLLDINLVPMLLAENVNFPALNRRLLTTLFRDEPLARRPRSSFLPPALLSRASTG